MVRLDQRHWRRLDDGFECAVAVETLGHWVRLGVFYGEAPGSHMAGRHSAFWRTRMGSFHGWNARFGNWPQQCLTLLLHTRPVRA